MLPVAALAARALPATAGAPTVRAVRPTEGGGLGTPGVGGRPTGGVAFSDTLKGAIDRVDASQKTSDAEIQRFVAGESDNVHDAMIAMNEAQLHFQLMTEVRNKLLDGYQELMRMQV